MPKAKPAWRIRARNWCFTLNNPTAAEQGLVEGWKARVEAGDLISYTVGQTEKGEEEGTLHYQGYLELDKPARLSKMKKLLKRAHWSKRIATGAECTDYCQKEDTRVAGGFRWCYGTMKKSGLSGDMAESVANGVPLAEIAEEFPMQYIKHFKGIQALREIGQKDRVDPPIIEVYYGGTGTGKSFTARTKYPDAFKVAWPGKSGQWWWDRYDHQETVLLDEFNMQITLTELLRFLDRGAYPVQVKGGYATMNSKRLVFTTNVPPQEWYPGTRQVHRDALWRRLKEYGTVYKCTKRTRDPINDPPVLEVDPEFVELPVRIREAMADEE